MKFLVKLLVLVMMINLLPIGIDVIPSNAAGNVVVELTSVSGEKGKTATVALKISGAANVSGVTAGQLEISYDPSMVSISDANISFTSLMNGYMTEKNAAYTANSAFLTWMTTGTGISQGGTVANLTFNLLKEGTSTIAIKSIKLSNQEGAPVPSSSITMKNSTVTSKLIVYPTSVSLNKSAIELLVGESQSLSAVVSPSSSTDKTVTWSSSNTSVATVDSTGKVTAKGPGSATITATSKLGGKKASCKVTVSQKPIPITAVNINKTNIKIAVGMEESLVALFTPSNATNKKVTWTSSDENIVKVSENGKITGIAKGSATVTVRTADGGKTAYSTITVVDPIKVTSIKLDKSSMSVSVGQSGQLPNNIGCLDF